MDSIFLETDFPKDAAFATLYPLTPEGNWTYSYLGLPLPIIVDTCRIWMWRVPNSSDIS